MVAVCMKVWAVVGSLVCGEVVEADLWCGGGWVRGAVERVRALMGAGAGQLSKRKA